METTFGGADVHPGIHLKYCTSLAIKSEILGGRTPQTPIFIGHGADEIPFGN